VDNGIDFPHATQAIQIRRRRHRLDQPKRFTTETVYAVADMHPHQARPDHLATCIRGHWSIENKLHWVRDGTYDEDRSQIRTANGTQIMATLPRHRHRRAAPSRHHQHRRRQPPPRPQPPSLPVITRHHLMTLPGALALMIIFSFLTEAGEKSICDGASRPAFSWRWPY
jgi:hypothetical protein